MTASFEATKPFPAETRVRHGAAQESSLPSLGLPDLTGFESPKSRKATGRCVFAWPPQVGAGSSYSLSAVDLDEFSAAEDDAVLAARFDEPTGELLLVELRIEAAKGEQLAMRAPISGSSAD